MSNRGRYDPKHGYIRTPGGKSAHETYTWTDRPKCPECGKLMSENDTVIDEKIVFSWWCNDTKHCNYAHMASEYNQASIAERHTNQNKDYSRYGISAYMADRTLENYEGSKPLTSALKDCINNPCDILLTGGTGTGKTHLAVSVLKKIIDQKKRNCFFQNVSSLIFNINDAYAEDTVNNRPSQIIDRYVNFDVLVLDDLGAEKTTDHVRNVLYMIIHGRLEQGNYTIVTTNSTIVSIEQSHGERLASRLKSYKVLSTTGKDYRGRR